VVLVVAAAVVVGFCGPKHEPALAAVTAVDVRTLPEWWTADPVCGGCLTELFACCRGREAGLTRDDEVVVGRMVTGGFLGCCCLLDAGMAGFDGGEGCLFIVLITCLMNSCSLRNFFLS